MQFDGAIFDLDGTLANTLEDLADALNRVLVGQGLRARGNAWYKRMIGHGIRQLVSDALPPRERTAQTIATCYEAMIADYSAHSLVKTRLYDGIAELVGVLRADGVKMAVF